jgi:hypothetical protein
MTGTSTGLPSRHGPEEIRMPATRRRHVAVTVIGVIEALWWLFVVSTGYNLGRAFRHYGGSTEWDAFARVGPFFVPGLFGLFVAVRFGLRKGRRWPLGVFLVLAAAANLAFAGWEVSNLRPEHGDHLSLQDVIFMWFCVVGAVAAITALVLLRGTRGGSSETAFSAP